MMPIFILSFRRHFAKPSSLFALLAVLIFITAGCAAGPRPREPFTPGATVETLAASVSLSVKSPEGSNGGTGYLLYRHPDRFHLVMLTPFGSTALEFFARGDRVTVIFPSNGVAFAGAIKDLPAKGGLQGWQMMRWVIEEDPLFVPGTAGTVERTDDKGRKTVARYDGEGLLQRKTSEDGEAVYRDYLSAGGVPFPSVIEFTDNRGVEVKISFEEPEVNGPVDDTSLTPNLEGLTILPLKSMEGS